MNVEIEGKAPVMVIKGWHQLVLIATLLASIVVSYATLRSQSDENSRRIRDLEQQTVRREQVEDIQRRLQRIEDKLDESRRLR